MRKIAVLLPAYNEQQTIAMTIKEFHEELPDAAIWVINNRSSDRTESIALSTIAEIGCKGGVINEPRPGKGNAVRRGCLEIDADIYVLADADLTYPAHQVHELIRSIEDNSADLVVGDRRTSGQYAKENKRAMHGFGNWLVCILVNKLFKAELSDIMSGYRAFNKLFIRSYPILVEGFEIETDMTLHALDKRFRILEVPVEYKDRPEGSYSKLNTVRDGAKVISTITQILRYYRPFVFFGFIGIFFALLGLVSGYPVLLDWFTSGYIYHVPLAILAAGLEIISIVFISIGLILDSISHQDKRNFEFNLMTTSSIHKGYKQ